MYFILYITQQINLELTTGHCQSRIHRLKKPDQIVPLLYVDLTDYTH